MTSVVPGIGGTLLPERYLATHLLTDAPAPSATVVHTRLQRWWARVAARCGPASPLRLLFDDVAMPLFGMLGFSAHDAVFDGPVCRVRLATRSGTPVALVITTWAGRPSARWADVARHAHGIGAAWGVVLAPPFLSIVPTHGHSTRRSIDVSLPTAVERGTVPYLVAVAHASRFDPPVPGSDTSTLADLLVRAAAYQDGVRGDLQEGVETSLRVLAPTITRASHGRPSKAPARAPIDEALTLVYRVLFLLFAESRQLVPHDSPIYAEAYAVSRLCRDALVGSPAGLWDALAATTRLSRFGCRTTDLRVAPFNGALFARASAPALEQRRRRTARRSSRDDRDDAMKQTLVALGSRPTRAGLETINYRDLGVEHRGAVYDRILDIVPAARAPAPEARTSTGRRGNRHSRLRRETGTFYTPQPLADFVVRRTLAPLVEGASADRLLDIRVLDPAMGSGAFLVAACRYLAAAYEDALVDEGRIPADEVDDHARASMRRTIAERCLAGVDRNGTAVQLARLSLWLSTLSRDRPLGFLDHRLRTGDSLVGAWPADLQRVRMHASRHTVPLPLFDAAEIGQAMHAAIGPIRAMLDRPDDTVKDVHAKSTAWQQFTSADSPLHRWRLAAHVWCARWFGGPAARPPADAETRALIDAVVRADRTLTTAHLSRRLHEAAAIAAAHGFFHWPLEFPDVFYDADGQDRPDAGFDAIIGNPPWEMLRREAGDPEARPQALLRYVRESGQYPSCVDGHLNLYQAFVDRTLSLVRRGGRIGLVLPWSLATDDGAARLRRTLLEQTRTDLIVGLDNADGLFPIHRGLRVAVVAATRGGPTTHLRVISGLRTGDQIDALPARGTDGTQVTRLSVADLERISGPAVRIPDLRRQGSLALLLSLAGRFPRLGSPQGWGLTFGRELNATDVRNDLRPSSDDGVAVVEGKHLAPFLADITTARRLPRTLIAHHIAPTRYDHPRVGYRDVSGVGNRLTLIAAVIPAHVVTTHTVFVARQRVDPVAQHFLCACLNSYVLNAVVRVLMGGHVTTSLAEHLPVPTWRGDRLDRRIARLAQRLAARPGTGRTAARLQALLAHRFGLTRSEFIEVLDGFPLVPRADRAAALGSFDGIAPT